MVAPVLPDKVMNIKSNKKKYKLTFYRFSLYYDTSIHILSKRITTYFLTEIKINQQIRVVVLPLAYFSQPVRVELIVKGLTLPEGLGHNSS